MINQLPKMSDNSYNPYNFVAVKSNFHQHPRETVLKKGLYLSAFSLYLTNFSHKAIKGFFNFILFLRAQFSLGLKQTKYEYRYRINLSFKAPNLRLVKAEDVKTFFTSMKDSSSLLDVSQII